MPALAEQHDPIEAAPVDEGTKLLVRAITEHMKAQSKINADGHAKTTAAIDRQTERMEKVTRDYARYGFLALAGAFLLTLVAMFMLGQARGVDVGETAKAVTSTTRALAEPALPVAASPPAEE